MCTRELRAGVVFALGVVAAVSLQASTCDRRSRVLQMDQLERAKHGAAAQDAHTTSSYRTAENNHFYVKFLTNSLS